MKRNAVAWAALVLSAAALAGPRFVTRPVGAVQEIPAEGQKAARALSEAFGAVADFARPSVVQITVQKKAGAHLPGGLEKIDPKDREELLKRFFGPGSGFKFENQQFGAGQGTGSGFVYDDRGHILTNNHVVSGADTITVTFHDGETATGKVVGTDADADVAVIKVDTTHYRALPKGPSSKLRVGEWVMAIGSPFGLEQTVTAGIISATERGTVGINKYESFLQTDCAINPGNSGGPLVDMNGRVVGINSAIATASRSNAGVGFAIPMDMASVLADKLIKDGKVSRARVGLAFAHEMLTPSLAKKLGLAETVHGVVVAAVSKESPGEKAGLKDGDVIVEFDGRPINTVANFRNLVSASDAGKSYLVKFYRAGKAQEARVTPALEQDVKFSFGQASGLSGFGLEVEPISAESAAHHGYSDDVTGLLVTSVARGGSADKAGMEKGDLITDVVVGKQIVPVHKAADLARAAEGRQSLVVYARDVNHPDAEAQMVTLSRKP